MKLLVIRLSSIGDIVFTTPLLRCLKQQIPGCTIHFVTKQQFKAVTQYNPHIDQFWYYGEDNLDELIQAFRAEAFDYVLDLHNNWRTLKIKRALSGVKAYTLDKESWRKELLILTGWNLMLGRHIVQRTLDVAKPLGVVDDGKGLEFYVPEECRVKETDIPTSHLAGYVGLVIGASYATKKLPTDQLQKLVQLIDYPIILIGGKEDASEGEQVAKVAVGKVYNACGKFSLLESADLVRRASLIISHDTGMQYIACAYQKKVIAIWGGTSPKLDVEPYYGSAQGTKMYENIVLNLPCQPCSKFGKKTCPKKHFNCMKQINVEEVTAIAHRYLGKI